MYVYNAKNRLTMFGNTLYSTVHESRYVNSNLKWATVTNYELGLEAAFLNNMVGFELSLYKKRTNDMLLYLPVQGVIGMNPPAQNAGNVENPHRRGTRPGGLPHPQAPQRPARQDRRPLPGPLLPFHEPAGRHLQPDLTLK